MWEFASHRYKGRQNSKINICVSSYKMIDMKVVQIDPILYNEDKWWPLPFILPRRPLSAYLSFLSPQPFPGPLISNVLACQKLVCNQHRLNFCEFLSHHKYFRDFRRLVKVRSPLPGPMLTLLNQTTSLTYLSADFKHSLHSWAKKLAIFASKHSPSPCAAGVCWLIL